MSLETVLQIGKVLRSSENSLKYFKYVEPCPKDKDGNWPICITIPVKKDFSFDWEGMKITPEKDRENLYYLKFKTSDADNNPIKYLFGDIYYGLDNGIEKGGWFKTTKNKNKKGDINIHSYYEGIKFIHELTNSSLKSNDLIRFRESFYKNLDSIDNLLKYHFGIHSVLNETHNYNKSIILKDEASLLFHSARFVFDTICEKKQYKSELKKLLKKDVKEWYDLTETDYKKLWKAHKGQVFVHFDFQNENKRYWYQYEDITNDILELIYSKFTSPKRVGDKKVYVFDSYLYKTLCTGSDDNDKQSPRFNKDDRYKSASFSAEEVRDLFYGIRHCVSESKIISVIGTSIQLIVLPRGINLNEIDYRTFIDKNDENRIIVSNNEKEQFETFFNFSRDTNSKITAFDLIFCKKGGQSSPDKDLIEISNIEKSKLRLIMERINKIATEIEMERKKYIKTDKDLFPLKIAYSFRSILGNPRYDEKKKKVSFVANPKYQSHILKTLPLIYTETYCKDDVLLSAFIQNVEFSIRAGDPKYNFLKYDLKFLLSIQNNNSKINKYMETVNSKSYQIGLRIGKLSKPLKKAINSFEKRYVGLLSRHIMTKDDCEKFVKEINEMLVRQGKVWGQLSSESIEELVVLPIGEYDREKFAIGFMEGYFKYEVNDDKKVLITRIEKIITDYEGKDDFQNEIQVLTNALEEIK